MKYLAVCSARFVDARCNLSVALRLCGEQNYVPKFWKGVFLAHLIDLKPAVECYLWKLAPSNSTSLSTAFATTFIETERSISALGCLHHWKWAVNWNVYISSSWNISTVQNMYFFSVCFCHPVAPFITETKILAQVVNVVLFFAKIWNAFLGSPWKSLKIRSC